MADTDNNGVYEVDPKTSKQADILNAVPLTPGDGFIDGNVLAEDFSKEDPEYHKDERIVADTSKHKNKFRKVARFGIQNDDQYPGANVKLQLYYQRKPNGVTEWIDTPPDGFFDAKSLKGGEQIRIALGHRETLKLYEHLTSLYALCDYGIPYEKCKCTVYHDDVRAIPESEYADTFYYILDEFPEVLEDLAARIKSGVNFQPALVDVVEAHFLRQRKEALDLFEQKMRIALDDEHPDPLPSGQGSHDKWDERKWSTFFKKNKWILGHGLSYQFLNLLQPQASVGETDLSGRGDQIVDFAMNTVGDIKYSVLVELKLPSTQLIINDKKDKGYRNHTYHISKEFAGAVAQMQSQCESWLHKARSTESGKQLENSGIYTCQPKGILVIGHTGDLKDKKDRMLCFERFRRNLHNPEVITFDELFERARYIVGKEDTLQDES